MVVAIDDAVGLVLFSASFGVANALEQGRIDAHQCAGGAADGDRAVRWLWAPWPASRSTSWRIYFHSRSKRMSLSVAFVLLTVGLSMVELRGRAAMHCGFSPAAGVHDDRHGVLQHLPHSPRS